MSFPIALLSIPNTNFIISGNSNNSITIFNYKTGEQLRNLSGHIDFIKALA